MVGHRKRKVLDLPHDVFDSQPDTHAKAGERETDHLNRKAGQMAMKVKLQKKNVPAGALHKSKSDGREVPTAPQAPMQDSTCTQLQEALFDGNDHFECKLET